VRREPGLYDDFFRQPAPPRIRAGPPQFYEHCGLKALVYPDFIEVVECDIKTDPAGFIIGWEV